MGAASCSARKRYFEKPDYLQNVLINWIAQTETTLVCDRQCEAVGMAVEEMREAVTATVEMEDFRLRYDYCLHLVYFLDDRKYSHNVLESTNQHFFQFLFEE